MTTPATTRTVRKHLGFRPEYLDIDAKLRGRDYLVNETSYRRVSTCLGVINNPMLINWAKRTTLQKVEEILRDDQVLEGLRSELEYNEANTVAKNPGYTGWVDRLLDSARAAADEKRDAAADRGTSIHEVIAAVLNDPLNNLPSEEAGHALEFIADYGVTVDAAEVIVWDDTLRVAGTCDSIGRDQRGQRIIWDWKTGSGPWPEMAFQVGAYAGMLTRLTKEPVTAAYIVKLQANRYEVHQVTDLDSAELAFFYASMLHMEMKAPKAESGGKPSWWVTP